jgi:hypothetical protein
VTFSPPYTSYLHSLKNMARLSLSFSLQWPLSLICTVFFYNIAHLHSPLLVLLSLLLSCTWFVRTNFHPLQLQYRNIARAFHFCIPVTHTKHCVTPVVPHRWESIANIIRKFTASERPPLTLKRRMAYCFI